GLAFALRDAAERTVRRSGVAITELRISGGGSQSDEAMQLTADIFNLPASRPHTYETSGLGAAIDAAVGLGWHSDFDTAVKNMTRIEKTFTPNPQHTVIYEDLYTNIYQKMYTRLKPLYTHLRNQHK
ncbi:MAG: carbohydrate kinase, partial [Phototrophicales bacterium]